MTKILNIIKLCLDLGITAIDMICNFIKIYRETIAEFFKGRGLRQA